MSKTLWHRTRCADHQGTHVLPPHCAECIIVACCTGVYRPSTQSISHRTKCPYHVGSRR